MNIQGAAQNKQRSAEELLSRLLPRSAYSARRDAVLN